MNLTETQFINQQLYYCKLLTKHLLGQLCVALKPLKLNKLRKCQLLSCGQLFATQQAKKATRLFCPFSSPGKNTGQSPFPSAGDLSDPGNEPRSSVLQADSLSEAPGNPKALKFLHKIIKVKKRNYCPIHKLTGSLLF